MQRELVMPLNLVPNTSLLHRLQGVWKRVSEGLSFLNPSDWENTRIFSNLEEMEDYLFSFRE